MGLGIGFVTEIARKLMKASAGYKRFRDGSKTGYVVDFLQFRFAVLEPVFRGGYFPSFNIADSAITLGAVLLIVDELLRVRRGG